MEPVEKSSNALRFVTFNVCGMKSLLSRCAQWVPERSYGAMFERLRADVVCFQETKLQPDGIDKAMVLVPGFHSYFTCSLRPRGYSGVSFHVRDSVRVFSAEEGLTGWLSSTPGGAPYRERAAGLGAGVYPAISQKEGLDIDAQGRAITLDLGACVVIGLYCPADSSGTMTDYRDLFYQLLDWRVTQLHRAGRPVVVLGDLNVAREPIDSATLREALRRAKAPVDDADWKYGSVPRKAVNDWVEEARFHDTTREAHPNNATMFTCWDQSKNARPANFGSRIDYVLASEPIACADANILPDLMGSDHCPVYADLLLDGIEPQGAHRLPLLSRKYASKWQGGVMAFFAKRPRERGAKEGAVQDVKDGAKEHGAKEHGANEHGAKEHGAKEGAAEQDVKEDAKEPDAKEPDAKEHTAKEGVEEQDVEEGATEQDANEGTTEHSAKEGAGDQDDKEGAMEQDATEQNAKEGAMQAGAEKDVADTSHRSGNNRRERAPPLRKPASSRPGVPAGGVLKAQHQGSLSKLFAAKSTQWARLSERKPPLCTHNEPCVLKMSRKPPRKGEYFWLCARPHGGKSNASSQFQCKTFIWDSELRREAPSRAPR